MNYHELVEKYVRDHMKGDSNLYRALRHIDNDEPVEAKVAILNAFSFTESNNATFDEMTNLVYYLLKVLMSVTVDLPPLLEGMNAPGNSNYATLERYLKDRVDPDNEDAEPDLDPDDIPY